MTKPLKVLHILYELRFSGAEVMIKGASSFWKQNGVDNHVLGTAEVIGDFSVNLRKEGIVVHHLPHENSLRFYKKFINFLRLHRFDILLIHVEGTFLTYAFLARIAKTPTIIRVIHSASLFKGKVRLNRTIRRWIVRQLGVIQISVSDSVRENEQVRFFNPTVQINNWYDDDHYHPPSKKERKEARNSFGLSENDKVILSVGNCAPSKNHDSIIKAIPLLTKNRYNIKYWHVGKEEIEKREQNLVYDLKLDSMIQFWGSQENVRRFLWAADIFVMPSFYEGFGIAALEAYACNLPVVLARSPGLDFWGAYFPETIYTEATAESLARGVTVALEEGNKFKNHDQTLLITNFGTLNGAKKYLSLFLGNYAN